MYAWDTKKDIAFRQCLLSRVPGGTRTHDIQNHKQVVEFIGLPVFIGILAFPYFAFAPILRRIFAESFFSKFQMRYDFLFSRGCLFPLFAGTIFKSDAKIGKKFNIKNDFAVFFQKKASAVHYW